MAYFRVHSRAVASYLARSVLYTCAISGTSGSSGFGSVSIEQMESSTRASCQHTYARRDARGSIPFEIVKAGLHWSLKMSRQMLPLELMLGW